MGQGTSSIIESTKSQKQLGVKAHGILADGVERVTDHNTMLIICPLTGSAVGKPFCEILLTQTCIIAAAKRVIFVPSLAFSVEVAFPVTYILSPPAPPCSPSAGSLRFGFFLCFLFLFFIFIFSIIFYYFFFSFLSFSPLIPANSTIPSGVQVAGTPPHLHSPVKRLNQLLSQSRLILPALRGIVFYKYIPTVIPSRQSRDITLPHGITRRQPANPLVVPRIVLGPFYQP